MKNKEKMHEDVFNYLNSWSEQARSRNSEINPFFYMRNVRDERFMKGYWFPGNESYLCISFWAGGDSINKTPNIYFEINEKLGCRLIIVAKDSESKYAYFEKLVEELTYADNIQFTSSKKSKIWIKQLSNKCNHWNTTLEEFTLNDKRRIDEYIDKNELTDFDEFVSKFGFISPKDFDAMYSRVLKERDTLKELEVQKYREFLNKPKLPYALLGINIENFQGFKNSSISDLRPDARWIFITGENGYGKTTLLQAIALGASNDPELEKYLEDKSRISLELTSHNEKAFPVRTKGALKSIESYDFGQDVIGYGPVRLNVQSKSSENMESRSRNNVLSLFENDTLLKNINYELFATNYSDKGTFKELGEIINKVTNGRIIGIIVKEREVLFTETLSNGGRLAPLPLNKLAAGFRSIINIVIDIYLRLKRKSDNISYEKFHGIVLIDEIENHLHPILQRELPTTLSQVFPNIQFIVSTHSPIPLLAAEKKSIILKVNRTKEDGVSVERLDEMIDFPTLLPNTILTSPIFGFQNIFSESKNDDEFVRVETTFDEVIQNDEQSRRIQQHLSKETTDAILKLLKK